MSYKFRHVCELRAVPSKPKNYEYAKSIEEDFECANSTVQPYIIRIHGFNIRLDHRVLFFSTLTMEQRDSLERSSSEILVPQSLLNGSGSGNGHTGGSEVPTGGQTTLTLQPNLPTSESSPVVDSVLQSDVSLLGGSYK